VHDYHAVEVLIDRLRNELDDLERNPVAEVRIRADTIFSPEALQQAYEMQTTDTPLQGSALFVERRAERECRTCGHAWTATDDDLTGHWVVCPECGALSPTQGGGNIEVVGVTRAPRPQD
jgi:Zn finger protein HypA/HybF involved in hydrogenase expression